MRKLMNDEAGFIVSAELILVLTIGVLAMVVGLASIRDSVTAELNDVASAFGAFDQSFSYRTVTATLGGGGGTTNHGVANGSGFKDRSDDCDCEAITYSDGGVKAGTGSGAEAP